VFGAVAAFVVLGIVVAQRFGWIDLSDKSRKTSGGSSSIVGIGDEVFAPTRHEAQIELDRQSQLPAPAPVPGDGGEAGIFDGKIVIRVDNHER
jgi:hypothetical protein